MSIRHQWGVHREILCLTLHNNSHYSYQCTTVGSITLYTGTCILWAWLSSPLPPTPVCGYMYLCHGVECHWAWSVHTSASLCVLCSHILYIAPKAPPSPLFTDQRIYIDYCVLHLALDCLDQHSVIRI